MIERDVHTAEEPSESYDRKLGGKGYDMVSSDGSKKQPPFSENLFMLVF